MVSKTPYTAGAGKVCVATTTSPVVVPSPHFQLRVIAELPAEGDESNVQVSAVLQLMAETAENGGLPAGIPTDTTIVELFVWPFVSVTVKVIVRGPAVG